MMTQFIILLKVGGRIVVMDLWDLLRSVFALFIVVDPIGQIPIFIELTRDMNKEGRRKAFRTAVLTGSILLLVFALAGQQLFSLFGISLYSFMIAGGILLLLLSIEIIVRIEWTRKYASVEDVGVVPVAFPLLVGPGAITTTIVTLQASGIVIALSSILIVMLIAWVALRLIDRIHRLLGNTGSTVIARVLAVFVAAIAIQFILTGIRFYYP
jgi:multiple antibiotic resistance protein